MRILVLQVALCLVSATVMAQNGNLGPARGPEEIPSPQVKFKKNSHDFGTVDFGTKDKIEFEFSNTGSQPLKLTSARSTCECFSVILPKKSVAPGRKGKVVVTFDSSKAKYNLEGCVYVHTNDPAMPIYQLKLKAYIKLDFDFEPKEIDFGKVPCGKVSEMKLTIRPRKEDIAVKEVTTSSPHLSVSLLPWSDDGAAVVLVRTNPESPPCQLAGQLVNVYTTSKRESKIPVPVKGYLTGDIRIVPGEARLSRTSAGGSPVAKILVFTTSDEFNITKVRAPKWLICKIGEVRPGRRYNLIIRAGDGLPSGKVEKEITIETDHKVQRRITIPVIIQPARKRGK